MTIRELMEKTGYSRSQVQRRLELLRPALNGGVRKGPNNALQFSTDVANLLIRLRELEARGFRPIDAAAQVLAEFTEKHRKAAERPDTVHETRCSAVDWVIAGSYVGIAAALVAIALALWLR